MRVLFPVEYKFSIQVGFLYTILGYNEIYYLIKKNVKMKYIEHFSQYLNVKKMFTLVGTWMSKYNVLALDTTPSVRKF